MKKLTYAPMRTYSSTRRMAQELADKLTQADGITYTMTEAIDMALFDACKNFPKYADNFAMNFPGYDHAEDRNNNT